jgi:DNA-binding MurR/RpiR family transcriptional regulator
MESALFALREHFPRLPAAEKKAAQYVLDEPRKVLHCNITELAKHCGVSQAAIVRLCRRIGIEGFSDFKLRLSYDVFRTTDERFLPDLQIESAMDGPQVVKGVIGNLQRSLARLQSLCDVNLLSQAADRIRFAPMNYAFGVGASGLAAQDFYQKMIRIGIPCAHSHDTDFQVIAACNLTKEDTALVISNSGETAAMTAVSGWAKKNGAFLITLTMETDNTLRRNADLPLLVPSLEQVYRTGASVSRINQLAVIDMLFSLLIFKDLDTTIATLEKTIAATHPGKSS